MKPRTLALFALFAAPALLVSACTEAEDTTKSTTSSTVADKSADAADDEAATDDTADLGDEAPTTTENAAAAAADHSEFCAVFVELDARFAEATGDESDATDLVAGMNRLAGVAPEYLADDAELVASETERVIAKANAEGVGVNDVDPEWFADGYEEASSAVFGAGYTKCGLMDDLAPPEGGEAPEGVEVPES